MKTRKSRTSEKEVAEIISPVNVHATGTGGGANSRRWVWPVALLLSLATLVVTGIWLIGYVSKNPVASPVRPAEESPRLPAEIDRPMPPSDGAAQEAALPGEGASKSPATPPATGDIQVREVSDEVLSLMASGRQHERKEEFSLAKSAYRKAYEIDPQYEEAASAIKRVSDQITERAYRKALAAGIAALEKKDYPAASKHLSRAKSLKPDAADASAALAKLDRAVRQDRIARLRQTGQKAEAAENWPAASKTYASILALDPENAFARQGINRARRQMSILAEVRIFTGQPDTLIEQSSLDKALATLQEARALEPKGPQLKQHIALLERLVAEAQEPVRVTIASDSLTQVDVYRIGRLGRFSEKTLDLKPGVYIVVGHREGYQDVRREIVVRPGQQNQRVTVICKVKV
jgi:tetratricopeptide (TPR) repeat protein